MSDSELPDSIAANIAELNQDERAVHRCPGRERLGATRSDLGRVRSAGRRHRFATGRRVGARRRRARLRNGILLGPAHAARCAAGGGRPDAGPARHRPADDGADRDQLPAGGGTRRTVPLPDASFDLAISEFGASLWADPALWIPEAARLLRPGGRLVFLTNSFIAFLCAIDEGGTSETLQRPHFGAYRMQWSGETGVEFHLSHGDWIDVLRTNEFEIERLIELQAPPDSDAALVLRPGAPGVGVEVAARGDLGGPARHRRELRPTRTAPSA